MKSLGIGLSAALLLTAPAHATLLDATGSVTFQGFGVFLGATNPPAACQTTFNFSPYGTQSCTGQVGYSQGPAVTITGSADGTGTTSNATSNGPTARTDLNVSGGDFQSGAGSSNVTTNLTYYVSVVPIGTPPIPIQVPLTFTDAGSVSGAATSNDAVQATASTTLNVFEGSIAVDGTSSFVDDNVDLSGPTSYSATHHLVFDLSEGTAIARVELSAYCNFFSQTNGAGNGNCTAIADPLFGFDQSALDALLGTNTFPLSNYFEIVYSPNLGSSGPTSVPEPASLAFFGVGLGALGLMRRKRKRT